MNIVICETCYNDCDLIDADDVTFDPEDEVECELCESPISGDYYRVHQVRLAERHSEQIREAICGCFMRGCAEVGDSEGSVWDDTNGTLWEVFSEVFQSDGSTCDRLMERAICDGDMDSVEPPDDLDCPCGNTLDQWVYEVKKIQTIVTVHVPRDLPSDISGMPSFPDYASQIEYFRSDCSRFLVHLTRGRQLSYGYENVAYENVEREFSAAEVLWLILSSGIIRANQGKGMRCPAVCFTEKPLAGLKDTLVGHEASTRRGKALTWAPYGVMFEKDYARDRGARPVISCDSSTETCLPNKDKYLVVPLTSKSNWTHEREWRVSGDFQFDIEEAIVLVATFDQAAAFESALRTANLRVKGILPLYDLFALV